MNILFLTISYSTKTHKNFYEDLLREFLEDGHRVFVACAIERRSKEKPGITEEDGINVLRIRTLNITGQVSLVEKGLATLTVDCLFKRMIRKKYANISFDLILYPTPPITWTSTIKDVKKRYNARSYLMLKDIFPQNAVDLQMMRKGMLFRYFKYKEHELYDVSDYIGCMSPRNVEYLLDNNRWIDRKKVEICPNCIKINEEVPDRKTTIYDVRKKYNIPSDALLFLYGGSLGRPQGVDFIIRCLDSQKDNSGVYFLIIGNGSEYFRLKNFVEANRLNNVKVEAYLPREEYQQIAQQCDAGLIFLDYRFTIPNFPSRLLDYLKIAIPVLAVTDKSSDIGKIAEENGFGYYVPSNDIQMFNDAILKLRNANLKLMGKKGWDYLKANYSTKIGERIILKHFET